ncbi:MAG: hypothetical protein AAFY80_14140 [Pseudomonadota bacterium]
MREIDTSKQIEIVTDTTPYGAALVLFGPMFLLCGLYFFDLAKRFLGFGRVFDGAFGALLASGAASLALGAMVLVLLREVRKGAQPVVFIGPDGYRDVRMSPVKIPWSEITRITHMGGRAAHIRLFLTPEMTDKALGPPGLARTWRALGWLSAVPVFTSSERTIQRPHGGLYPIVRAYAAAHGGPKMG